MVRLDRKGDRIESYAMMNHVVEKDGKMNTVPVGVYDSMQRYREYEQAVVWPGGMTEVPSDYASGSAASTCGCL